MTPAQAIAQLDRFLANVQGEDVTLLRLDDDGVVRATVTCRAKVDRAPPEGAPAGIKPAGYSLIMSPTPLLAAGWPDGNPANIVPVENAGDKLVLDGQSNKRWTVVWVDAKKINNQVVRIDLKASG